MRGQKQVKSENLSNQGGAGKRPFSLSLDLHFRGLTPSAATLSPQKERCTPLLLGDSDFVTASSGPRCTAPSSGEARGFAPHPNDGPRLRSAPTLGRLPPDASAWLRHSSLDATHPLRGSGTPSGSCQTRRFKSHGNVKSRGKSQVKDLSATR